MTPSCLRGFQRRSCRKNIVDVISRAGPVCASEQQSAGGHPKVRGSRTWALLLLGCGNEFNHGRAPRRSDGASGNHLKAEASSGIHDLPADPPGMWRTQMFPRSSQRWELLPWGRSQGRLLPHGNRCGSFMSCCYCCCLQRAASVNIMAVNKCIKTLLILFNVLFWVSVRVSPWAYRGGGGGGGGVSFILWSRWGCFSLLRLSGWGRNSGSDSEEFRLRSFGDPRWGFCVHLRRNCCSSWAWGGEAGGQRSWKLRGLGSWGLDLLLDPSFSSFSRLEWNLKPVLFFH